MDDDCFFLASKLISNLENKLKNDPLIDEYDILPVKDSTTNRNPIYVVDHKLAIESWAAKLMLTAASTLLRRFKEKAQKPTTSDVDQLCSLTRCLLLLIPDHASAWNLRKELIEKHFLTLETDLDLARVILTKHPKSSETFAHRKWLLCKKLSSNIGDENIISRNQPNPDEIKNYASEKNEKIVTLELTDKSPGEAEPVQDSLQGNSSSSRQGDSINRFRTAVKDLPHSTERHRCIRHEMDVCSRAADRYHSNYNAWSHRIWVLQNLTCCCQQTMLEELTKTHKFASLHISDHSSFHYRQFLISQVISSNRDGIDRLVFELEFTKDLISFYPGHEAIWNHRRFTLDRLYNILPQNVADVVPHDIETPKEEDESLAPHVIKRSKLDSFSGKDLVANERDWCEVGLSSAASDSWQLNLIRRHICWIDSRLIGSLSS